MRDCFNTNGKLELNDNFTFLYHMTNEDILLLFVHFSGYVLHTTIYSPCIFLTMGYKDKTQTQNFILGHTTMHLDHFM